MVLREAEIEDLLQAHLAQVVVDAQDLRLVDVLVQLGRERARRRLVVAEGLLHDDARRWSSGRRRFRFLIDGAEQEGRDLEVEDGQRLAP